MKEHFNNTLRNKLNASKVIVAPKFETIESVPYVIDALLDGGIKIIEITLRTTIAIDCIRKVTEQFPEMNVIAGTVIEMEQLQKVQDAGVIAAVSPGIQPKILEYAKKIKLPFAPGVATPSEIALGLELECNVFKFFPAEMLGGIKYLRRIYSSYAHKEIQFIPLGGIDTSNAYEYLKEPSVLAIGGSWVADQELINNQDWEEIKKRAIVASQL
tara:strand:+ start:2369 stop:3010 length:642 start_codon:yes stop_codon:yes gene_type:complete